MLRGRNKELGKLCSMCISSYLLYVWECVKCESRSSQTSRRFVVFVLFCLLYKWWSSRQERERHSALPGGKVLAAGHRPLSIIHLPQPQYPMTDKRGQLVHVCDRNDYIWNHVPIFRGSIVFFVSSAFIIESIEFAIHKKVIYESLLTIKDGINFKCCCFTYYFLETVICQSSADKLPAVSSLQRLCLQHHWPCKGSVWPSTIMFSVLVICLQSKIKHVKIICSPEKVNLSVTFHWSLLGDSKRFSLVQFIWH